jgi:hypothetical protein
VQVLDRNISGTETANAKATNFLPQLSIGVS